MPHHLLVLLVDTSVYVFGEVVFQGQLALKDLFQYVVFAGADPQGISFPRIQIKEAHEVVVHTQRMDKFELALFALLPFSLLVESLRGAV